MYWTVSLFGRGIYTQNGPKYVRISVFGLFLYTTIKPDLTFLKQKIRASCMPFRHVHQGIFLLCSLKYVPGVSEQTFPRKHLYTVVRISCGSREMSVGYH
ncbi:Uncharacterised protein [Salmonella enterica subsp. enterica]|nr:Uncharacterised protein [Salmonella enterica subsp. enterica]